MMRNRRAPHPLDVVDPRLLTTGPLSIVAPVDPTPGTAAVRLACLAMRQAGFWGEPGFPVEVDHPRFASAVEQVKEFMGDERKAFEAARTAIDG